MGAQLDPPATGRESGLGLVSGLDFQLLPPPRLFLNRRLISFID